MGWGVSIVHEDYFSRENFQNKYDVQHAIEEEKKMYDRAKQSIFALSIQTEPQKMLELKEGMSPIMALQYLTEDLFEELENSTIRLYRLNMLLNEWDDCLESNGKLRKPTEDFKPFIYGDYINNEEEENENNQNAISVS